MHNCSIIIYKIDWVCLPGLDINSIAGGDTLGTQSDVGRRAIYLMENAIKPLQDAFTGIEKVLYFNKIYLKLYTGYLHYSVHVQY